MSDSSTISVFHTEASSISRSATTTLLLVVLESFAFGIYSLLFSLSFAVLIRSDLRLVSKKSLLLAVCAFMYMLSAAHFGIDLYCFCEDERQSRTLQASAISCLTDAATDSSAQCPWLDSVLDGNPPGPAFIDMQIELGVLLSLNVFLSDLIVLWRGWVLWPRKRGVQVVSVLLALGTLTMLLGFYTSGGCSFANELSVAAFALSWLTNVWATFLVAYKAWQHWRQIKSHLQVSLRTRAGRALLLFVESGLLYCALWMFLLISSIILILFYKPWESMSVSMHNLASGMHVIEFGPLIDLVGMYPTAVILLVEMSNNYAQRTLLGMDDIPTLPMLQTSVRSPVWGDTNAQSGDIRRYSRLPDVVERSVLTSTTMTSTVRESAQAL